MCTRRRPTVSESRTPQVQDLPYLKRVALQELWQELFRKPAHPKLRRDLMVPILAYGLQHRARGGRRPGTQAKLRTMAKELERNWRCSSPPLRIKAGSKL